jgi:hypothetical protein
MVGVALISIVLGVTRGVGRLGRLSREFRRRARIAAWEERGWRQGLIGRLASEAEARRNWAVLRPKDRDLADQWAMEASDCSRQVREVLEIVAHHARLRRKYVRAAARPWEPVAPDPPEPRETLVWHCVALPKEPLPPGERWYAEDSGPNPDRSGR